MLKFFEVDSRSMKPCRGLLACAWLFSLVSTPFAAVAECNFNETLETDSSILLTQAPLAEMYDPYKAFQESYAEVESFNQLNDMIKSITMTIASLVPEVGPIVSLILNIFWPSGPGPEKYLLDAMQDWTKKYVEAKLANLLTELIKRDVNQTQHSSRAANGKCSRPIMHWMLATSKRQMLTCPLRLYISIKHT